MTSIPTSTLVVQRFASALYGVQVGSNTMAAVNRDIASLGLTTTLNSYYAASFGSMANSDVATMLVANLGITGAAATNAVAYVVGQLNGVATNAKGAVIANILAAFSGLTADATYGAAATAWNTNIDAAAAYNGTADAPVGAVVSTFALTTGVDTLTGTAGNDTFLANPGASNAATFTSFDSIDGGAGTNDTFNIVSIGAFTVPATATVKNIEVANITGDNTVTADVTGWTGLTALKSSSIGGATLTAAATTAVTVANTTGAVAVTGGSTQTVTTAAAATATVTLSGAKGAVSLTDVVSGTGALTGGAIAVTGGTTVTVNQTLKQATVNTTTTAGAVSVTGTSDTTAVSVTNTKAVAPSLTVAGIANGAVSVADVNYGSATKAGTITTVAVSGYTSLNINDNALTTLSVANGSSNIIIDNSGLTTATNKTLALTADGLTGGTLDDADIYTTLNVTTANNASTLSNITFGGVTALTVAGTKVLTLTSTTGMSALKSLTVTGAAGVTADVSGLSTVTSVDTSGTTGVSTLTLNATKATFTGGDGTDVITVSGNVSKAITLGNGSDKLVLGGGTVTAATTGGAGTDTLSISAAAAAVASNTSAFAGLVSGFESLVLTGSTNQTIDLAVLGNYSSVSTSGGNGLTLSNLPTGGTLSLTGAGTAYTVGNSAFTAGTNDVLNVALTDGSGAAVSFAATGITASGVETVAITTADTQATPTNPTDLLTVLGNSASTITVAGNAGLNLTAATTALTLLDASGITAGSLTFTSGALAAAATINGSPTGTNTVDFTLATKAVTYTGGTGNDVITASNGKNNVITLGDGANSVTGTSGNNTITGGAGADTVTLTTGNNVVNLGNGANAFTATSGNNTYVGGTGVDTITVGAGINTITTGGGADVVTFTTAGANVNVYSTITDAHAGMQIVFTDLGTETFVSAKATLAGTAVFQDYANAVVAGATQAAHQTNGAFGWFQWGGNTFLVEVKHDTTAGIAQTFVNGVDQIVCLTGLVDLSTATGAGTNVLTLA